MIFNFFKNKQKEYAEQIYGMFSPPIRLAKEFGNWKKSSKTFGEIFIEDEYLIGFFNMFITFIGKKILNITDSKEFGYVMMECYKKMDGTFSSVDKIQKMTDIFTLLTGGENQNFNQGGAEASIVFHISCFPDAQNTYSDNLLFKEAIKFINSNEHKSQKSLQQKVFEGFPKSYYQELPENSLIAHRIFQNTFIKRLNKKFHVDD
jgi:hypothetical protein